MTNSQRIIDIQFEIETLSKSAKRIALDYKEINDAEYHSRKGELGMLETKLREVVGNIRDLQQEQVRIEKGFIGKDIGSYSYKEIHRRVRQNRTEG
jgi:hypothetical protein